MRDSREGLPTQLPVAVELAVVVVLLTLVVVIKAARGTVVAGNNRPAGGIRCFGCGEVRHRQSECKKTAGKKNLFHNLDDYVEDDIEIEGELMYDEEHRVEELLLEGDVGTALVVR